MATPLLVMNGINTFITAYMTKMKVHAEENGLIDASGNWSDAMKDSNRFNFLIITSKVLPVFLTFYTGLQVLFKYGRRAERYHSSANNYRSLSNDCYFRIQKLDMYYLLKKDEDRVTFIQQEITKHDNFMEDAKKREEQASKEAFVIKKKNVETYRKIYEAEMDKLERKQNDENQQGNNSIRKKYALHDSYMRLADASVGGDDSFEQSQSQVKKGMDEDDTKTRKLSGVLAINKSPRTQLLDSKIKARAQWENMRKYNMSYMLNPLRKSHESSQSTASTKSTNSSEIDVSSDMSEDFKTKFRKTFGKKSK